MLSFRVEPENETILVEQVLEESPVVTGFDIVVLIQNPWSSTKASPGLCIKPLPCYFEKFITYVIYCIKLFNSNVTYLMRYLP